MHFSRTPGIALQVFCGALLLPVLSHAADETPTKKKVVFFACTPNPPAHEYEMIFRERAKAEGYTFESYKYSATANQATVESFFEAATAGDYAMFVIICHGNADWLILHECSDVSQQGFYWNRYTNPKGYKGLWSYKDFGRYLGRGTKEPIIGLHARGVKKLFDTAGVPDNSIVFLASCGGWDLDRIWWAFSNDEFIAIDGCFSNYLATGNAFNEVLRHLSGETATQTSNSRPMSKACNSNTSLARAAMLAHHGTNTTTLAPSVTSHKPERNQTITVNVTYKDGQVNFDTVMDRGKDAKKAIVFEKDLCGTQIDKRRWVNDSQLAFEVTPTIPRYFILKVNPDFAVSKKNKDIKLIGNRYVPQGKGIGNWAPPRKRAAKDEPDYGNNGYDGANQTSASPVENPYRWRVWCADAPVGPVLMQRITEQDITSTITVPDVPWGEDMVFILMDGDPGTGITFSSPNAPANFTIDNPPGAEWYSHVIYSPEAWQLGDSDVVTLQSVDTSGLRHSQDVTFTVVEREGSLSVESVYDHNVAETAFPCDDEVAFEYVVFNSGNTTMTDIAVSIEGFGIDSGTLTVDPSYIDTLLPGTYVPISINVTRNGTQTAGVFEGIVRVDAETAEDPNYTTNGAIELRLDHPPQLSGPTGMLAVRVGMPVSFDVAASDADADPLTYEIAGPCEGCNLTTNGTGVHVTWTPGAGNSGYNTILVIARDGYLDRSFLTEIDVEGPVNVAAVPQPDTYDASEPLPVDLYYLNRNTVAATVSEETVDVFSDAFDGTLLYHGTVPVNETLAPEEELERQTSIPAQPGHQGLYVRVTAATDVGTNAYVDESEFLFPDCNVNGVFDSADIAGGTSDDYNMNGMPDECEPDCNTNGILDACDVDCGEGICVSHPGGCGSSSDCQPDGVPDDCQIVSNDCNANGIPDDCDGITAGDFDGDGDVDLDDFAALATCSSGPGSTPEAPTPACIDAYLHAFDYDADDDVDLEDFAIFQAQFTGGEEPCNPCPDVNQDNNIDNGDRLFILSGSCGQDPRCDINCDGSVTGQDADAIFLHRCWLMQAEDCQPECPESIPE